MTSSVCAGGATHSAQRLAHPPAGHLGSVAEERGHYAWRETLSSVHHPIHSFIPPLFLYCLSIHTSIYPSCNSSTHHRVYPSISLCIIPLPFVHSLIHLSIFYFIQPSSNSSLHQTSEISLFTYHLLIYPTIYHQVYPSIHPSLIPSSSPFICPSSKIILPSIYHSLRVLYIHPFIITQSSRTSIYL